jgi:hypothetical protein
MISADISRSERSACFAFLANRVAMVLRDILIGFFQHIMIGFFQPIIHDIVVEFFKPVVLDVATGLFDGVRGAASGFKEVFVTLKAAVKELWLYSSARNISRLLATAIILTMMPLLAKTLHKIMETNIPARRGASNLAPAAPAAPGP